jgi:L-iditol 2-dehydrogenase
MKAARLEAVGSLVIREVGEPTAQAGELLVRVEACGVCGTDRHIFHGEYPAALPMTPGHEFAGTVTAVGPGCAIEVGTRLTVDPNISCGICVECRRGESCLCPRRVALGVDLDGGLAEFVLVPERQAYPIPAGMPITWGALCEPLACCLHALDLAAIKPGMQVAIFGGGVIGQIMVQLSALSGAVSTVLVTRQAERRSLAARLGATATYDPHAVDMPAALLGQGGVLARGADVVFECAGVVETFEQSMATARRGGTVVVVGVAPQDAISAIRPYDIFSRELRIVGSFLNPLTHGRAVELASSGRLDLASLITSERPLEQAPALLGAPPRPGQVKEMVIPNSD